MLNDDVMIVDLQYSDLNEMINEMLNGELWVVFVDGDHLVEDEVVTVDQVLHYYGRV